MEILSGKELTNLPEVSFERSKEMLNEFLRLYEFTAQKNNMPDFYRFDYTFKEQMLNTMDFQ